MRTAIKQILDRSIHRFCVWHILKKVSKKVGVEFYNPSFRNRFQSYVWESEIETSLWENGHLLQGILSCIGLNGWHLYMVIDVFHEDFLDRDEKYITWGRRKKFSSNFVNRKLSLTEFYMRFESALPQQRQMKFKPTKSWVRETCTKNKTRVREIHEWVLYLCEFQNISRQTSFMLLDCERCPVWGSPCGFSIVESDKGVRGREVVYDL